MNKLSVLQHKAVKLIEGGRYRDHITAYYSQLKILELKDLTTHKITKIVHSYQRSKPPSPFITRMKTSNVSKRITRATWYRRLAPEPQREKVAVGKRPVGSGDS